MIKYLFALSVLFSTLATAQTVRQLDEHTHGNADLSMVISGEQVAISFESPADSIVGFEHLPKNDEQRALIANARETLGNYRKLFEFSDTANCELVEKSVSWSLDAELARHEEHKHEEHKHEEHEHEEHKEHEHEEHEHKEHEHKEHEHEEHGHEEHDSDHSGHSEFATEFLLNCQNIQNLTEIKVQIFDQFSGLETIHFEAVLDQGPRSEVLKPGNNMISLAQ